MKARDFQYLTLGIVLGCLATLAGAASAQHVDERTAHLNGPEWHNGYIADCDGTAREHDMPHGWCYTIDGVPVGCVPKLGRLLLPKGAE